MGADTSLCVRGRYLIFLLAERLAPIAQEIGA